MDLRNLRNRRDQAPAETAESPASGNVPVADESEGAPVGDTALEITASSPPPDPQLHQQAIAPNESGEERMDDRSVSTPGATAEIPGEEDGPAAAKVLEDVPDLRTETETPALGEVSAGEGPLSDAPPTRAPQIEELAAPSVPTTLQAEEMFAPPRPPRLGGDERPSETSRHEDVGNTPYHGHHGMGINERIEDISVRSFKKLEQIESLMGDEREIDKSLISKLQTKIETLTLHIDDVKTDRDRRIQKWEADFASQNAQLERAKPYLSFFEAALPEWLSINDLKHWTSSTEEGAPADILSKVVWNLIPSYIRVVDEITREPVVPKNLTSATADFSVVVCSIFAQDGASIVAWHDRANERLKERGYEFVHLAVGSPIDVDMVTGSIQGKTRIETVKRMPLLKEGAVITKADVIGA